MPGKDRQRQLAREKLQRQMTRRAEAARRRRRAQAVSGAALALVAVVALSAFAVTKLHHGKKPKPSASAAVCSFTKPPAAQAGQVPRKVNPPPVTAPKKGSAVVQITTSQGALTISLDRGRAPCTVGSFTSLVMQKYFDKTPCHRLTTSGIFVLQCGDPAGTGRGGPGYQFGEEGLPASSGATIDYPAGTVAMANAGPGTTGSQFFIVYRDTKFPPNYTIFGKVSKGLDAILAIAKAGAVDPKGKPAGDGKPKTPVTIEQAKLS
ncbi:MAG: peptidylprolyl isomerase [Pseudonocardiales bacterium]